MSFTTWHDVTRLRGSVAEVISQVFTKKYIHCGFAYQHGNEAIETRESSSINETLVFQRLLIMNLSYLDIVRYLERCPTIKEVHHDMIVFLQDIETTNWELPQIEIESGLINDRASIGKNGESVA